MVAHGAMAFAHLLGLCPSIVDMSGSRGQPRSRITRMMGLLGPLLLLAAAAAARHHHDPPSPPTGGFPDSGKECQWAASTHNAQYHIINNVTDRNGVLKAEPLNDANGVFQYKGLFHVMNQVGAAQPLVVLSAPLLLCFARPRPAASSRVPPRASLTPR